MYQLLLFSYATELILDSFYGKQALFLQKVYYVWIGNKVVR